MHVGPYDNEPATLAAMEEYAKAQDLELDFGENRFHHEIYLSDMRQCQPVRKVILKQLEQDAGQAHDHGNEVQQTLAGKGRKSMYQYKTLENSSYEQLAECFCLAFSDYYFPMALFPEQLRGVLEQSGVDLALSYGAFMEGRLVGFIFNSSSLYCGQRVVFDAGTAVIPEHRGKGVFHQMFQIMERQLIQAKVEAYYLEVLKQNERAIQLYQKHGFAVDREYVVLQSGEGTAQDIQFPGKECEFSQFDFSAVSNCVTVKPCYEHSTGVLQKNPHLYGVRYIREGDKISAFCVYAKENGSILQLGYQELPSLKLIVQSLLSTFSSIGVKNLDTSYPQVMELFDSLHFQEVTRQFEMSKQLGPSMESQLG